MIRKAMTAPRGAVAQVAAAACALTLIFATGCNRGPQHYIAHGEKLLSEGKYADAELDFRKALQDAPNNGEAMYGLARVLVKQDRIVDGFKSLEEASRLLPARSDVRIAMADVALAIYTIDPRQKRFYDQIGQISRELLAKDAKSTDGLRLKGYLALADRKPQDAILAFRQAGGDGLTDSRIGLGLCQALFQEGQFTEAEQLGLRLLAKEKAYLPIYDLLYFEYLRKDRPADGAKILEKKIEANPQDPGAIIQLAAHHSRLKDVPAMEKALQRLRENTANFPRARLQVGDFYAGLRLWPEALREYEAGAQGAAQDRYLYYKKLASLQERLGNREESLRNVEMVLKEKPADSEARALRASLYLDSPKEEDQTTALADLQALVKESREDGTLQANLGRAQLMKAQLEEARQSFSQALRIRPEAVLPRIGLAELSLRQGKTADAINYVDEILAKDGQNTQARLLRATALRSGGRYAEARAELSRIKPDAAVQLAVEFELAMLALMEKRYQDAEQGFRRLEQQGGAGQRPVFGLADVYLAQEKFDQAVAVVSAEVGRNPDSWPLRNLLATVSLRARKYDLAQEQYRQMLRIAPSSMEARLLSGEAYRQQGDTANADRVFAEVAKLAPNDVAAQMMLAIAHHTAGRTAEAQQTYRKVLALNPENPIALNNLAYLLTEAGSDLNEAERLAQRAIQKAKNQPNYLDTLGLIYLKKGTKDSAIQLFGVLVRQHPENAEYRYHLAMALVAKGDSVRARQELKQARAKATDQRLAAKIQELLAQIG